MTKKTTCHQDRPLPPDPEGMNERRSLWAERALCSFMSNPRTDREDALTDLLADLMHWCDRNGRDFDHNFMHARFHYEAETAGDPMMEKLPGM